MAHAIPGLSADIRPSLLLVEIDGKTHIDFTGTCSTPLSTRELRSHSQAGRYYTVGTCPTRTCSLVLVSLVVEKQKSGGGKTDEIIRYN